VPDVEAIWGMYLKTGLHQLGNVTVLIQFLWALRKKASRSRKMKIKNEKIIKKWNTVKNKPGHIPKIQVSGHQN
jgi:hypothetical protein